MIKTPTRKIVIAADHAGFDMKQALLARFPFMVDLGAHTLDPNDGFPDIVGPAVDAVKNEDAFGIIICGTGIGVSIAANRHKGIYAALCTTPVMAKLARCHNNANVLCLGGRIIDLDVAVDCVEQFLTTDHLGGKYQNRMEQLDQ